MSRWRPRSTASRARAGHLVRHDRVLATAKHFAGDGGTTYGTGPTPAGSYTIDQGVDRGQPRGARRGSPSRRTCRPCKQHHVGIGHAVLLQRRLDRGRPRQAGQDARQQGADHRRAEAADGFDGFVISDWQGHRPDRPATTPTRCALVNAGIDMVMVPTTTREVRDDALGRGQRRRGDRCPGSTTRCTRILTEKFKLGLFEHPYTDRTQCAKIGSAAHRAVARQAAAESQVLLKNSGGVAAARRSRPTVYVAGSNADDLGNQAGGWTVTWQGGVGEPRSPAQRSWRASRQRTDGARDVTARTRRRRCRGSDVGVVVVGETPYAEGVGDVGGPQGPTTRRQRRRASRRRSARRADTAAVDKVCAAMQVRRCSSSPGRPHDHRRRAARWTRWSRPGCRAARVKASPTCCSARSRSPAGCP